LLGRFFLVAFALAWLISVPIALQAQGFVAARMFPPPAQFLIGLAPLIAAWWVTRRTSERKPWLDRALRFRVQAPWYVVAIGLPWLVLGIALGFDSATGRSLPTLGFDLQVAVFGAAWLVLAFGEEAGWRALALPELMRTRGFWAASTVLGAVWCIWHYPRLFASPYLHFDASGAAALAQFSLQILVANYLICWLYLRTQSAIITALFHASMNVVATVHSLSALDPAITLALGAMALLVLLVDRRRLRSI
jgi:membrane protease YdiL (CAAX protease family)